MQKFFIRLFYFAALTLQNGFILIYLYLFLVNPIFTSSVWGSQNKNIEMPTKTPSFQAAKSYAEKAEAITLTETMVPMRKK